MSRKLAQSQNTWWAHIIRRNPRTFWTGPWQAQCLRSNLCIPLNGRVVGAKEFTRNPVFGSVAGTILKSNPGSIWNGRVVAASVQQKPLHCFAPVAGTFLKSNPCIFLNGRKVDTSLHKKLLHLFWTCGRRSVRGATHAVWTEPVAGAWSCGRRKQPVSWSRYLGVSNLGVAGLQSWQSKCAPWILHVWAWQVCKLESQNPHIGIKKKDVQHYKLPHRQSRRPRAHDWEQKNTFLNQIFSDVEPKYEINLAAAYLEPDVFSWSSYRFYWIKHPFWAKGKAAVQGRLAKGHVFQTDKFLLSDKFCLKSTTSQAKSLQPQQPQNPHVNLQSTRACQPQPESSWAVPPVSVASSGTR